MVTHALLRDWWRGIGQKDQYEMSAEAKRLAFRYKDRNYKSVHNPDKCEFRFNGLFKLARWRSYAISETEINAIGGIDFFERMINMINAESRYGYDLKPKFEFAIVKHENVIELARLC